MMIGKTKRKIVYRGIAGLYAVALVFVSLGCGKPKTAEKPVVVETPAAVVEKKAQAEKKESPKVAAESVYKMLREQNPFRADHAIRREIITAGASQPNNPLKGIVWDEQAPYAIIGSRIVRVGDFVGEKRIVKIDENAVTLEEATGEKEVLRLR